MTKVNISDEKGLKKGIRKRAKGDLDVVQKLTGLRAEHVERGSQAEFMERRAEEFKDWNLVGYIGRRFGNRGNLEKMAGYHYNEGVLKSTGVDLYEHGVGDKEEEKKATSELFNNIFRNTALVLIFLLGVGFGAEGFMAGYAIDGMAGAWIGMSIGLGFAAVVTPIAAYTEANSGRNKSKNSVERSSWERGMSDGKDVVQEVKAEHDKAKVGKKIEDVVKKGEVHDERLSVLEKILSDRPSVSKVASSFKDRVKASKSDKKAAGMVPAVA